MFQLKVDLLARDPQVYAWKPKITIGIWSGTVVEWKEVWNGAMCANTYPYIFCAFQRSKAF
jgi:hypothetical protein